MHAGRREVTLRRNEPQASRVHGVIVGDVANDRSTLDKPTECFSNVRRLPKCIAVARSRTALGRCGAFSDGTLDIQ
jgi:hypothetical protein